MSAHRYLCVKEWGLTERRVIRVYIDHRIKVELRHLYNPRARKRRIARFVDDVRMFILRKKYGHKYIVIAHMYGCGISTVRSALNRVVYISQSAGKGHTSNLTHSKVAQSAQYLEA